MKNKLVKHTCKAALLFLSISILSCKKSEEPNPIVNNTGDTSKPKITVLTDTLKGKWEVTNSTHNGTVDNSSKGLRMVFDANGTYLLVNTNYKGTWEFIDNKTKILIDKDVPEFKTTWTIDQLTNKNFDVTFISPFTGGKVVWKMLRYKF